MKRALQLFIEGKEIDKFYNLIQQINTVSIKTQNSD